jgi:hypothetical protein
VKTPEEIYKDCVARGAYILNEDTVREIQDDALSDTVSLKRCPFCGARGVVEADYLFWPFTFFGKNYQARCSRCMCALRHHDTPELAEREWNER